MSATSPIKASVYIEEIVELRRQLRELEDQARGLAEDLARAVEDRRRALQGWAEARKVVLELEAALQLARDQLPKTP